MRHREADGRADDAISVLHLISSLEPGGAEKMLCNLVLGSEGRGLRHHVVAMVANGTHADLLRARGIPVYTLGMRRGRPSLSGALRFARLLRRKRPRIVQSWMYHADLLALISGPVAGARVVWNIRSAMHGGIDGLLTRVCAKLSSVPDAVVVNSETGRQLHADRGYQPRRWYLIGNGFDLDVFKPSPDSRAAVRRELGVQTDTSVVGLIARFDPLKGHEMFLAAAALLAADLPQVHFLLAGNGVSPENRALAEMIASYGLTDRVHLLGNRSDIPRLTASLDIACCTSVGEAFPNVVGEAMACAVPCVVTDVGDAPRLVGNPELVVASGDSNALADLWARLLRMNPGERRKLGEDGRTRIAAHYSLDAIVHQYLELYQSVTGRH